MNDIDFLAELATWILEINWGTDMTESMSLWNEISYKMNVEKKINWNDFYDQNTFKLKYSFKETKEKILSWLKN